MKLNLGCGKDTRPGYHNVDLIPGLGVDEVADLSQLPWPWKDNTATEIMMLDFLEHFPYRMTQFILGECWRVLEPGGKLIVQVPDFEHCAYAVLHPEEYAFLCNRCGESMADGGTNWPRCGKCGQSIEDIQDAAIHRLYGGQDRKGNWHFTAFTEEILVRMLTQAGFKNPVSLEQDHQWANWNFKLQATKDGDGWGE